MPHQERERRNRERMNREQNDDWARQVDWERGRGPYEDYGWERGQSVLPEFRDRSVHRSDYERGQGQGNRRQEEQGRYNRREWNKEGPYTGMGPKGYRRSDERIFEDVCERLTRHGRIDARGMQVNVKDGEVTLTGSVHDRQMKRIAENVVERVHGVQDVHNQLRVEERSGMRESGVPVTGEGRVDEVGGSGVYPASGPQAPGDAEARGMASWGQGERGAEGYQDSGRSELNMPREDQERNQSEGT